MDKISVLIVDDPAVVRQGLRTFLDLQDDIDVAGEATNGAEAVEQVRRLLPDVVLMDLEMPEMDGIEATRLIKNEWPDVWVAVLTMHSEYRADALEAGTDVFLAKGCPVQELLDAVSIQKPDSHMRGGTK